MPTEATPLKSAPSASAPSPAALFADEKSTAFHAFINELKCLIGVGSLTLPFVTEQFGLFASLTGVLLLCYAAWEGIRLLIYCVAHDRRQRKSSLPGGGDDGSEGAGAWRNVSEAAFGPVGWWLTLLSLVMAQLGVATARLPLKEHAPPDTLLDDPESLFSKLVDNTGSAAAHLRQLAADGAAARK